MLRLVTTMMALMLSVSAYGTDDDICEQDGPVRFDGKIAYEKGSDNPYTGSVCIDHPMEQINDKLYLQFNFVDGKRHGPSYEYRPNGTKMFERMYANGIAEGISTKWNEKGAKVKEEIWIDGDFMYEKRYDSRRGYLAGQQMFVRSPGFAEIARELSDDYKIPLEFTIITMHWNREGQMTYRAGLYNKTKPDGSFRNMQGPFRGNRPWRGSRQGLHTRWYDNGKKRSEGFFVNGTLMHYEAWEETAKPVCLATRASPEDKLEITYFDQYGAETDVENIDCQAY